MYTDANVDAASWSTVAFFFLAHGETKTKRSVNHYDDLVYKPLRRRTYDPTRIEPVGKPYREVCLRSELWPWMAHQLNSWSKHPGIRNEQVLAYCREEQKYVCIELLFCLTDHDIWRADLQIHRVDGRDTAYIPAKFHRNSFKNKREINIQYIF